MTAGAAVLAIDQGTSGTKAIVLDPAVGVLASVVVPIRPSHLAGGRVEQDPAALLDSVLEAGQRAVSMAGAGVGQVSLANQGETVLVWDPRSGVPAGPALSWQDGRAADVCADLAQHRDWIGARTGLVLDPYFSAPKMSWLRRNGATDGVVTTTDTWLLHHLTGAFVTDVSTASRSLLVDLDRAAWDQELVDTFGLAGEQLPAIVACDENIGETTAFGSPMTVGGLIVDQQAALLAEGCWQPGAAKCTFGTGAFLLANTGRSAPRSTAGLTTSVAWQVGGATDYCIDGQVFTAGSAIRWIVDLGLVRSAAEIDSMVAQDSGGVLCVPALAGLAAPWWRSGAAASLTGMTLATGRAEVVLAVLQGIAAQVAALVACIASDLEAAPATLCVDGGLTRCHALMQAVADLTQLPVQVYPFDHATALGAAALGLLASGAASDFAQAVPEWTPATGYRPRWSADRAQAFQERWNAAAAGPDTATGE